MRHCILVVALLAAALAACGRASQESRLSPSPAVPAPSASASQPVAPLASIFPAASPIAAPRTDQIQVFFSTGDRLVGEAVTVNPQHPVRDALAFLVSGPRSAGHYTEIPKGTRLLGVEGKVR